MKGAEKIFIHGEELAKQSDLSKEIIDRMNAIGNAEWQSRQYTDQRIAEIPEADPQKWVDSGFDYSYEDPNQVLPVSITVEPFGDGYGFDLGNDCYYVNNNSMIDQSYAMCKIVINNTTDTDQMLNFKLNQQSENAFDFGMFSLLNTDLVANIEDINTNVAITFNGYNGDIDYNIGVPVGESYVTVKYIKDGSGSQQTDTFKFKLAQDNRVTETKHMAMREDSDFIKIEVETGLSGVLNPSSNIANVNLKPEESKFEELIALVRKGIYKNIVLTDGIYTCFMCLEEVTEEEITYKNLHPINNGSRGRYYRTLNFNFDEAGVLTTLTLSRSGDRFLTTGETGSWELSNYTPVYKKYVDDTINEVTDEKLAGVLPNDLLHYKGHVDTIEDLPANGQASAPIKTSAPNYNGVNVGRKDSNLSAYDVTLGPTSLYYVAGRFKETSTQVPEGCFCLKTDYPEMISVVRYDINGHTICILVQANADKPVYLNSNQNASWSTVTNNKMFAVYDGAIRTNFPLKTPTWIPGGISVKVVNANHSTTVTEAYRYAQATNPDTGLTYYYDPGYIVMVPESDTSDYAKLYFGDSLAKHRDVYTVGENKDIYYCNMSQEFERWAKSDGYTKAEIDAMIGEIDTVLDEILNEPELVEDNIEVPDVG